MTSTRDLQVAPLLQWLDHNGYWRSDLEIRPSKMGGLGVFYKNGDSQLDAHSLMKDPLLLRIPKANILAAKNSSIYNLLVDYVPKNPNVNLTKRMFGLVLAVVYEVLLADRSPWHGYLCSIDFEQLTVPLCLWDKDDRENFGNTEVDLRNLLSHDELFEFYVEAVCFAKHYALLVPVPRVLDISDKMVSISIVLQKHKLLLHEFGKIMQAVVSRSFDIDTYYELALVPGADLFNHIEPGWDAARLKMVPRENIHFVCDSHVCSTCGEPECDDHSDSDDDDNDDSDMLEHDGIDRDGGADDSNDNETELADGSSNGSSIDTIEEESEGDADPVSETSSGCPSANGHAVKNGNDHSCPNGHADEKGNNQPPNGHADKTGNGHADKTCNSHLNGHATSANNGHTGPDANTDVSCPIPKKNGHAGPDKHSCDKDNDDDDDDNNDNEHAPPEPVILEITLDYIQKMEQESENLLDADTEEDEQEGLTISDMDDGSEIDHVFRGQNEDLARQLSDSSKCCDIVLVREPSSEFDHEIFNLYGYEPNAYLLHRYGFTAKLNVSDTCLLLVQLFRYLNNLKQRLLPEKIEQLEAKLNWLEAGGFDAINQVVFQLQGCCHEHEQDLDADAEHEFEEFGDAPELWPLAPRVAFSGKCSPQTYAILALVEMPFKMFKLKLNAPGRTERLRIRAVRDLLVSPTGPTKKFDNIIKTWCKERLERYPPLQPSANFETIKTLVEHEKMILNKFVMNH